MGLPETAGSPKYLNGIGDPAFLLPGLTAPGAECSAKGVKMDYLWTKPIGSVLKSTMLMAVLGLLLCPAASYAESLKLFYIVDKEALKPGTVSKVNKKPAELLPFLSVDKGGDVVIRSGNVSLIMAYNSADDVHRFQDRARDIQPLERPLMNGISLTICCLF